MVDVQAQLVAQLLCCIPLTSVEPVLTWLTSAMPQSEQKDLLLQVWISSVIVVLMHQSAHFQHLCQRLL